MPDWVKPSFAIFDIWAVGTLTLRAERQSAMMLKITNGRLNTSLARDALYLYQYGNSWCQWVKIGELIVCCGCVSMFQVEVKPYVLDDQLCDECQGARCGGKFAPFFCASVTCLQNYCEQCWMQIHSRPGREYHKPLVKEGADRPRSLPFRWC